MQGRLERTYGRLFRYMLKAANPFKKALIHTQNVTHIYINRQALEILKNDRYTDACYFFGDHLKYLNDGTIWADADLKSTGHFYSPVRNRGMYGNRNALSLATEYYSKAREYWKKGDLEKSLFFLGAAIHLTQDMAVPQHANIRLLDDHKQYESFIRRTYLNTPIFAVDRGGYYLGSIEEAVKCNARNSLKIYSRFKHIRDDYRRFHAISRFTIPMAQRTTAGCLLMFYKDAGKSKR